MLKMVKFMTRFFINSCFMNDLYLLYSVIETFFFLLKKNRSFDVSKSLQVASGRMID